MAGVSLAPAVKVGARDQYGNTVTSDALNVTLALGNNPGGATLSGTTSVAMSGGVATFGAVSLDKVGTGYTLVASAPGLTSATSTAFPVTAAGAAKLVFLTQPSTGSAGAALTPAVRVQLLDAFDNPTASTAPVTISLETNPGGGTLSGTTQVAAVDGVATLNNLRIDKVGSGYQLRASSGGLTGAVSTAFSITPGAASRIVFSQQPSTTLVGAAITPAVQVSFLDAQGNAVPDATPTVSLSLGSNPSGGSLSGTTVVKAVAGVATFSNLAVSVPGNGYTLVASSSGLFSATSVGFNVVTGPPAKLGFTVWPSAKVAAGASFNARVVVRDSSGNTVTDSPVQVSLALANAPDAVLNGSTLATTVNGVAIFSGLSVDKAGTGYALVASSTGLTPATSPSFAVEPGAASALAFVSQPGTTAVGAAITPAVRVALQDARGNTVTGSSASVSLELGNNPSGASLGGTRTVAAVNGVATFSGLSVNKEGAGYTLRASTATLPDATSTAFDVTATVDPVRQLVFRNVPTSAVAGGKLAAFRVELQDSQGNVRTDGTQTVTVALGNNPTGDTLLGTLAVPLVNGVATFDTLSLRKAGGGYTLVASAPGATGATSPAFSVTSAAADRFVLTLATSVTAGQETTLSARAVDAYGNLVSTYSKPVKVTSSDTRATLPATAAFVEGVFTGVSVTFKSEGAQTLTLTDANEASLTGSASITVLAGPGVPDGGPGVPDSGTGGTDGGPDGGPGAPDGGPSVPDGGSGGTDGGGGDTDAGTDNPGSGPEDKGCGCGATSGTDAGLWLGLLLLTRSLVGRGRRVKTSA